MKNFIQTIDPEDNYITLHWIVKSFNNLSRFSSRYVVNINIAEKILVSQVV